MIVPVLEITQESSMETKTWLTDVTVAAEGLSLVLGGEARLCDATGKQARYTLQVTIPFTAAATEEIHSIALTQIGGVVVDPGPQRSDLAAQLCWFTLPAGATDLAAVEIRRLVHVETPQPVVPNLDPTPVEGVTP